MSLFVYLQTTTSMYHIVIVVIVSLTGPLPLVRAYKSDVFTLNNTTSIGSFLYFSPMVIIPLSTCYLPSLDAGLIKDSFSPHLQANPCR